MITELERSRVLRDYMRENVDKLVRDRPTFRNQERWEDGHVFTVVKGRSGPTKRCPDCDMLKSEREFGARPDRVSLRNVCRPCATARRRAWRAANTERDRATWRAAASRRRAKAKP